MMSEKQKRINRKKTERKFDGTDASFIAQSRVIHKLFLERMSQFTAFDADFDITYANNWLAKIEFCEAITTDETTMHEMAGIKEKRDKKVLEMIAKVSEVEFYAIKAFYEEPEVLHEFQFNKVSRLDQYSLNFIIDISTIRSLATDDYNTELTNAGMPPTLLPQIEVLFDELTAMEMYHEKFKRIRIKRTRLRIKDMNELYVQTFAVSTAASVIFASKPETAGMFVIK